MDAGVSIWSRTAERVLPIALLAVAAVSVPLMVWSPRGLPRLDVLRSEKAAVEDEVSVLSQEIRHLREEVRRVKSDPAAIERVARDQLGLVRQTEVVFHFER
jgi:cell division protein FtsB